MSTINTEFKVKHGLIVNGKTTLTGTTNEVGTITNGNWNASPIPLQYGGTGQDLSGATGYFVLNAGTLSVSTTIPATAITGTLSNPTTGVAATATQLATPRSINMTGDVDWSSSNFDGSGNVTGISTLSTTGVTPGTYKSVDVDAKGRITGGSNPTTLAGYGITDAGSFIVGVTSNGAGSLTFTRQDGSTFSVAVGQLGTIFDA